MPKSFHPVRPPDAMKPWRTARRAASPGLLLVLLLGAPACTLLFGDFEVRDTTGTGGAGSTASSGGATGSGTGGSGGSGAAAPVCGDGKVEGTETCDEGNDSDDACLLCAVQTGFTCSGEPSVCMPIPPQVVTVGVPTPLDLTIIDQLNHYDGTIASMNCAKLTLVDQGFPVIHQVTLKVGIDHPSCGDLVIKLVSPEGTVSTMMNRPGLDEQVDKYNEANGALADIRATSPITFDDSALYDAEKMGVTLGSSESVCKDDQRCSYRPNPDSGPGKGLADFNGENPAGNWRVCVADGDDNDIGKLQNATLTVLAWQK